MVFPAVVTALQASGLQPTVRERKSAVTAAIEKGMGTALAVAKQNDLALADLHTLETLANQLARCAADKPMVLDHEIVSSAQLRNSLRLQR
jgi:hypothetical protein